MENVNIFVLARNLSGFRSQVPTWPLWAVVLMPVQFSKRLLSGSDLSRVVHHPVASRETGQCGLSFCSVLNIFSMLIRNT